MPMFDTDEFISTCLEASRETESIPALSEVVSRAISMNASLNLRFPIPLDPDDDGILLQSPGLTIASAIFPRGFSTGVHNHTMPAIIGVWTGTEDNVIFEKAVHGVVAVDSIRVQAGQVLSLASDAIHDVHVPSSSWSGALHVYLGDLIGVKRSEWSEPLMEESPFDGENLHEKWLAGARETGLVAIP